MPEAGVREVSAVEICSLELAAQNTHRLVCQDYGHARALEIRATHVVVAEVDRGERVREVRSDEARRRLWMIVHRFRGDDHLERGAVQLGAIEIGFHDPSPGQVRLRQVRLREVGSRPASPHAGLLRKDWRA